MAKAFEAALSFLWETYGQEIGERLLDRNSANIDTESSPTHSFDLIF